MKTEDEIREKIKALEDDAKDSAAVDGETTELLRKLASALKWVLGEEEDL